MSKYVLAYVLWASTLVLTFLAAMTVRDTYIYILASTDLHRYTVHLNTQAITYLLGIGLLIFIVVSEHLYRTAVPKHQIFRRSAQIIGWVLFILGIFHLLYGANSLVNGQGLDSLRLILALVELVVGGALLWSPQVTRTIRKAG